MILYHMYMLFQMMSNKAVLIYMYKIKQVYDVIWVTIFLDVLFMQMI